VKEEDERNSSQQTDSPLRVNSLTDFRSWFSSRQKEVRAAAHSARQTVVLLLSIGFFAGHI